MKVTRCNDGQIEVVGNDGHKFLMSQDEALEFMGDLSKVLVGSEKIHAVVNFPSTSTEAEFCSFMDMADVLDYAERWNIPEHDIYILAHYQGLP